MRHVFIERHGRRCMTWRWLGSCVFAVFITAFLCDLFRGWFVFVTGCFVESRFRPSRRRFILAAVGIATMPQLTLFGLLLFEILFGFFAYLLLFLADTLFF